MPTVPLLDRPRGLVARVAFRYSRRRFGTLVQPLSAAAHHPGVLLASGALETVVDKRWNRLDVHLRWLAIQAVSGLIGCAWCTDYGYFEAHQQGVDPAKIRDVARWRDSDVYDERERIVLEFAEAATATPAVVDDDLVSRLRATFANDEIVELAGWIALENERSRFNAALGLTSQGFRERCEVPPAASSETVAA
jgi:alkylhydroperoxidase family enzyme